MMKKVIDFNKPGFAAETVRQERMKNLILDMQAETEKAGIQIEDLREFIIDPVEYGKNAYWESNKHLLPGGLNKDKAIAATEYQAGKVQAAFNEYQAIEKKAAKGLKINKASISTQIKKDDYNVHLNPDKEDHYKALENLIQSVKDVSEYTNINRWDVLRAIPTGIRVVNGELAINAYDFKDV